MTDRFQISIVEQRWLAECDPLYDYNSHGRLLLTISGIPIEEGTEEYGISESALALLRTVELDHTNACPAAQQLIFHGCGIFLMLGCPIGIDWTVRHFGDVVEISEVRKFPTTSVADAIPFPEVNLAVPIVDYAKPIAQFAKAAKLIFGEKRFDEEYDRSMYEDFWQEYNERLERASAIARIST